MGNDLRNELFERIWAEYYNKLRLFVSSLVRVDDPEDLVQDIMIKVLSRLHSYNPFYSFNTWIYSIARNHCRDFLRRKKISDRYVSFQSETVPSDGRRRTPTPEEIVLINETDKTVRIFLNSLAGGDRQISLLRFYEGMSYREIGKVLDMPAGTVKYRVHTIRSRLKKALEGKNEK